MITNKEFVTRVINDCGAITKDQHISERYILFIGRQIASTYIAQRIGDGSIFRDHNVMTTIECLKMKEVKSIDCCFVEFQLCKTLMRSQEKIPGLLYGRTGPGVYMVSNVDNSIHFNRINLREYNNSKNRRYGGVVKYVYYVDDGYLWIPDVHIEAVNVKVVTLKKREANKLSGCNCEEAEDCISEWDYEFVCPDSILDMVMKSTVQEVTGTRIQIPEDANPNMDLNQKTQTTL